MVFDRTVSFEVGTGRAILWADTPLGARFRVVIHGPGVSREFEGLAAFGRFAPRTLEFDVAQDARSGADLADPVAGSRARAVDTALRQAAGSARR